jgi:uncharacterized damage-inducible protein DinB
MSLNKALANESRHEGTLTRKLLERIPMDKAGWKPHEKSMSLGQLANHTAELFRWIPVILSTDSIDLVTQRFARGTAATQDELLAQYETNWQEAIGALDNATAEQLDGMWTLSKGDYVLFTIPRKVAIRSLALSHQYHHRGQLTVYLRLLDIPVPALYGPSADEIE